MKDQVTTKVRFIISLDKTIEPYESVPVNDAISMLDEIKKQIQDTVANNPSCYDWYFEPQVRSSMYDKEITFELLATRPLNNTEITARKKWEEGLQEEQRKQYEELKKKFEPQNEKDKQKSS